MQIVCLDGYNKENTKQTLPREREKERERGGKDIKHQRVPWKKTETAATPGTVCHLQQIDYGGAKEEEAAQNPCTEAVWKRHWSDRPLFCFVLLFIFYYQHWMQWKTNDVLCLVQIQAGVDLARRVHEVYTGGWVIDTKWLKRALFPQWFLLSGRSTANRPGGPVLWFWSVDRCAQVRNALGINLFHPFCARENWLLIVMRCWSGTLSSWSISL